MKPAAFEITLKVFLVRGNEFLALRDRNTGSGDLPGGRLAKGEIYRPWSEQMTRELREELGPEIRFELLDGDPLFVFPHLIEESGSEALGMAFRARYIAGPIRLSAEHDHFEWASIRNFEAGSLYRAHLADAVRRFQNLAQSESASKPSAI